VRAAATSTPSQAIPSGPLPTGTFRPASRHDSDVDLDKIAFADELIAKIIERKARAGVEQMIGNCIGGAGEFSSQMISRVSPVPVKGPSRRLAEAQAAKKAPLFQSLQPTAGRSD
jgi:hypothetical protein